MRGVDIDFYAILSGRVFALYVRAAELKRGAINREYLGCADSNGSFVGNSATVYFKRINRLLSFGEVVALVYDRFFNKKGADVK